MALALTIDLGTTNLKVGLVSEKGEVIYSISRGIPTIKKINGELAHHPEKLKSLLLKLCKTMVTKNMDREIRYIVPSTYQFGLMLLDDKKKPLTGLTLLTDIRAQRTFEAFKKEYADFDIYARTGCPLLTNYTLPRLFYLSRNETDIFDKAKYFIDSKAFLFEWLTGELVTDISTAAASQHFNINSYSWDVQLLSKIGISLAQLPAIEDGTSYTALLKEELQITLGLKKNIKVLLGVYDGAALAIGLGALKSQTGVINIGTSAMLRVVGDYAAFDNNANKRIQPYALTKKIFLNGGALNNAALPLNWLRESLFDVDLNSPEILQPQSTSPLICLPYLTGERDSAYGSYASCVFFGLRQYHNKTDLARAVMEGVAYSLRYIYEALTENSLQIDELYMGGGGTQISVWPQIFANIIGLPINISPIEHIALVGNAMLAFSAENKSVNPSVRELVLENQAVRIIPDSATAQHYDKNYAFFKKLREKLGPLYKEHIELSI